MARIPDVFDYDDAMEQGADPQPVTCRHCGVGDLHWQRVIRADGRSEVSRLFDDRMRPHVCKPSVDDFDVIPGG